ncbi:MAG: hypothetical protein Q4E05_09755, partial [Pseudoclavibacter sp.]|nr:hypothetical protein [Pseudoclavibacter sp.]
GSAIADPTGTSSSPTSSSSSSQGSAASASPTPTAAGFDPTLSSKSSLAAPPSVSFAASGWTGKQDESGSTYYVNPSNTCLVELTVSTHVGGSDDRAATESFLKSFVSGGGSAMNGSASVVEQPVSGASSIQMVQQPARYTTEQGETFEGVVVARVFSGSAHVVAITLLCSSGGFSESVAREALAGTQIALQPKQ